MTRLANVNTDDIPDAIALGCQMMCRVFNRDDDDIPFFESQVRPAAWLRFHPLFSEAHVPGRHLNALLTAQATAGVTVPDECLAKQERAAFYAYSGPVPLPLNRAHIGGPLRNFAPHNLREGFHALYALAHFRASASARALAEASIAAIERLWSPDRGWDRAALERRGLVVHEFDSGPFITGIARAIGPLVKYYRATGYGPALALARTLKDKAISEYFTREGAYDPATFGTHTHSTTCVLSSLAQLAELTADAALMGRVKAFYDIGLWVLRDRLGWVIENSHPDAHPDRGEVNNTGDVLETALILGAWGYPEYYADAERILRSHLLPSQLRDVSFITDPASEGEDDGMRDVAARHRGAFGFPAPYGHEPLGADHVSFNMDIVGGAVASLCEVRSHIARSDHAGHWVNLLFDQETPALKVESPYTHADLRVTVKQPGPLFVRVPPWVPAESIMVPGIDGPPPITNGYLAIAQPPVNQALTIAFPLVEEILVLCHRTRQIRARMRGDTVQAMDNFGADLTYFDPLDSIPSAAG
jgi:hypothetical protein